MLKEILDRKGISVYKASKETGISYSTLNDIVIEKTDIRNVSANILYRLAKYLELSMEALYGDPESGFTTVYLYNEGRNVILVFNGHRVQYLGPKNILGFHRVNRIKDNVVYADCFFISPDGTVYHEEDYIDLSDVLSEFENVLAGQYTVVVGKPGEKEKDILITQSLLVSDNLAILYYADPCIPDRCVQVRSMSRPKTSAVIRIKDCAVVSSNMSKTLTDRAVEAVKRNRDEIMEDIEEVAAYA